MNTHAYTYTSFLLLIYNCIVPLGFLPWEIQVALPGKASCDRVALPNLTGMLGVLVFPSTKSDMDCRICNVRTDVNACDCMHAGVFGHRK